MTAASQSPADAKLGPLVRVTRGLLWFALGALVMAFDARVLDLLWRWHVVPALAVQPLGLRSALGIVLMASWLTNADESKYLNPSPWMLVNTLAIWVLGWGAAGCP